MKYMLGIFEKFIVVNFECQNIVGCCGICHSPLLCSLLAIGNGYVLLNCCICVGGQNH